MILHHLSSIQRHRVEWMMRVVIRLILELRGFGSYLRAVFRVKTVENVTAILPLLVSEMLGENMCFYDTISIFYDSWLISDQSRFLLPDWFGKSIYPVNHRCANVNIGREGAGKERVIFLGCLVSKTWLTSALLCSLALYKSLIVPTSPLIPHKDGTARTV